VLALKRPAGGERALPVQRLDAVAPAALRRVVEHDDVHRHAPRRRNERHDVLHEPRRALARVAVERRGEIRAAAAARQTGKRRRRLARRRRVGNQQRQVVEPHSAALGQGAQRTRVVVVVVGQRQNDAPQRRLAQLARNVDAHVERERTRRQQRRSRRVGQQRAKDGVGQRAGRRGRRRLGDVSDEHESCAAHKGRRGLPRRKDRGAGNRPARRQRVVGERRVGEDAQLTPIDAAATDVHNASGRARGEREHEHGDEKTKNETKFDCAAPLWHCDRV
jgi:hypothetical protein